MRELRLEINGRVHRVRSLRTSEGLWLHFDGETYFLSAANSTKAKRRADRSRGPGAMTGHESGNCIVAPMPGKVKKVNVKVGDMVQAEQILIVMEAMKMEYNLAASRSGRVKEVNAQEGSQVELDRVLIELEAVEP